MRLSTTSFLTCAVSLAGFLASPLRADPVPAGDFPGISDIDYTKNGVKAGIELVTQVIKALNPTPTEGLNPKVAIVFSETANDFNLTITGGDFIGTTTQTISFSGEFWSGTVGITQSEPFLADDDLTLIGSFFHKKGPHNNDSQGPPASFNFFLDHPVVMDSSAFDRFHANTHVDHFAFDAQTAVESAPLGIGGFFIKGCTFTASGQHAIPLPPAVWSAATVLGGIGLLQLRKRVGK